MRQSLTQRSTDAQSGKEENQSMRLKQLNQHHQLNQLNQVNQLNQPNVVDSADAE
jgi:hypothetical protein